MSGPSIDRAILELRKLNLVLTGLESFAATLDTPEWWGYQGAMEDARAHIEMLINELKEENLNGIQRH